jgi:hypothetical protein
MASRTIAELHGIVDRGVEGGEIFFAAVAELERRERLAEHQREAERAHAQRVHRNQAIAVLSACLVLVLAALWMAISGR